MSMVADGAGDAILGAIRLGMATQELADTWAPYLTMGLTLAAQASKAAAAEWALRRDPTPRAG
jgi:hypothetical protein